MTLFNETMAHVDLPSGTGDDFYMFVGGCVVWGSAIASDDELMDAVSQYNAAQEVCVAIENEQQGGRRLNELMFDFPYNTLIKYGISPEFTKSRAFDAVAVVREMASWQTYTKSNKYTVKTYATRKSMPRIDYSKYYATTARKSYDAHVFK